MTERLVEEVANDHLWFYISEISYIADLPLGVKVWLGQHFSEDYFDVIISGWWLVCRVGTAENEKKTWFDNNEGGVYEDEIKLQEWTL